MQRITRKIINKKTALPIAFVAVAAFFCTMALVPGGIFAADSTSSSAADVQSKIADNSAKIADLQKQIDQYTTLLNSTSKQTQTLTSAIKSLDLTQQKLQANLKLTSDQISQTGLTLTQINADIRSTERKIASSSAALSQTMREIDQEESTSFVEALLKNDSVSDSWDYLNEVHSLQNKLALSFSDLRDEDALLNAKKDEATGETAKLTAYQKSLSDQQQVAAIAKTEKAKLLTDTKSQASVYNQNLAAAVAQKNTYEQELFAYESQLKITVNTAGIPDPNPNILSWPLDSVYITQYFGKTVDAKRLYVSGTHGGIDLRAAIGTPVHAAADGVVEDTEPTKYRAGCQYGKFVLINHPNGLSTIYGHLSLVAVKPGDTVHRGDVIGYSGDTGYAVGPHLHLGLYITSAIQIVDSSDLGSKTCAGIKTVAAPPSGYLDPMAYLPAISQ